MRDVRSQIQQKKGISTSFHSAHGHYFAGLSKLIEPEFKFSGRSKRPPKAPFNSMLSLGYTIIFYEIDAYIRRHKNIYLYLPESFEWIILCSGLIDRSRVKAILDNPEEFIESIEYFSWEQFFTKLLMQETEGTHLKYKKAELNPSFLQSYESPMSTGLF